MRFLLILQTLGLVIAPHPPCYCDIYENGASINDNDMCKEYDTVEEEWVCLPMDDTGYGGCAEDQIFCDNYNYPPPIPSPSPMPWWWVGCCGISLGRSRPVSWVLTRPLLRQLFRDCWLITKRWCYGRWSATLSSAGSSTPE